MEKLRHDLRVQTEAAERHKTAISLLQRKLQETENDLIELRTRPVLAPTPEPLPTAVEAKQQELPREVTSPSVAEKSRRPIGGWIFGVLALGLVGLLAVLFPRYSAEIQGLLFPATAAETESSDDAPQTAFTAPASSGEVRPPTAPATEPSPPPNPASLLGEVGSDHVTATPVLLPPVSARQSPSVDWNRSSLPVAAFTEGLFNPSGQLDFHRLRRIWTESQRGQLAPRGMDDQIAALYDGFDGVPAAARSGDPDSQYQLGLRLLVDAFSGYHRGIDASDPLREAYQWMQKAAQSANPDALYVGGQMRRLGIGGREDADKGLAVINFAARSGQADAQEFLGVEFLNLYFQTRMEEYARTSAANFRAAAEQGRPLGELLYGRMLTEGLGVPQDTPVGVRWLLKAYRNGKTEAVQYLQDAAAAGSEAAAAALAELGLGETLSGEASATADQETGPQETAIPPGPQEKAPGSEGRNPQQEFPHFVPGDVVGED